MMHRAFVDRNHALRLQRVMAHHAVCEDERNLAAKTRFFRRRNERGNVEGGPSTSLGVALSWPKGEQPRKILALLRQLLWIRDARQCAATAHAEVLTNHEVASIPLA